MPNFTANLANAVMTYKYKTLNINISAGGEGKPLLLLHGWGCEGSIFDGVRAYLEAQYTVYAFDLPGFGGSSEPDSVWCSEDYVDMLHSFVESYSLSAPTLVGHSFGGKLSILYASRYPVERMVLIGSAGVKPRRTLKYYYKVYSYKALRHLSQLLLPRAKAEQIIAKRRAKAGSSDYRNASERMRAILSRVVSEDMKSVMPKISAPTLLFWGDRDTATPISDAKIMERLIPDAGLVVATGCTHYAFLENRGLFDAVMKKFLIHNS